VRELRDPEEGGERGENQQSDKISGGTDCFGVLEEFEGFVGQSDDGGDGGEAQSYNQPYRVPHIKPLYFEEHAGAAFQDKPPLLIY
jgi:hypothetical protein